ncbi:uncharacterized protein FOMMEDRAFT_145122 [Fomitiporia mediterranea MF3/22]|uniref:uncharacterized protein n=1 Tax=Fomitiporia mediterranea (strain MF3/22) TaxID=694068 RepID=UPI0004408DC8|nr:uncharacterized protein FOMMEDRAFT_145122 [Fomitiporia mediterranea MF3/22]EJD05671.1 hypothetical protein FOMMEDRAFT_145122 [Fomitiporia mediterranea MF3/22]
MSDIQFIIEKPEKPARRVKKRSRLITSCDACRLKKIKCRPKDHGGGRCEACEASDSACVFEERDRIRRLRGIANFTVAPTWYARDTEPSILAQAGPSFTAVETKERSSTPSSSSAATGSSALPKKAEQKRSATNTVGATPSSGEHRPGPDKYSNVFSFFDPQRQGYPDPRLLPHFVDLFLIYAGSLFPFFDPDTTTRAAREGTLSPLIANCLSAYAARFSDNIRHFPGKRHLSGDSFLDAAKCLLLGPVPDKLERLHALILIAWSENGAGRPNNFFTYSQMAFSLAVELGLDSEERICSDSSEVARDRYRLTFWSVSWLIIIACSVVGKPCPLHVDECSTDMPNPGLKFYGPLSRDVMYQAFRIVLNLMTSLINYSNAGKANTPSPFRDAGLRQIQNTITMFRDWIPPSLTFNKENLSYTVSLREAFVFYLVHVLLHCFLVISHCPSLFWASQPANTVSEVPRLDIAWSSAVAIVDILNLLESENLMFTQGMSSTFMPLSIARGALLLAQSDAKSVINGLGVTAEDFELTNSIYLETTAQMLQVLSRYWGNPHSVDIADEPVELHGIQTVPRETVPQLLKPLSLPYRFTLPTGPIIVPRRYLDQSRESDGQTQQLGDGWQIVPLTSGKEMAVVDNYNLVRRYNFWQDMGPPSSSM